MSRTFGTTASRVEVTDYAGIQSLATLSWSAWVKATTGGHITNKGTGKVLQFGGLTGTVTATIARAGGDEVIVSQADSSLTDGEWHHIVLTCSATESKVYADGTEVTYATHTNPGGALSADAGSNLIIGNATTKNDPFSGRLAEVGVWSGVLTATEAYALYACKATPALWAAIPNGATIAGAWRLVVEGDSETNSVSGGNAGAVTGATHYKHLDLEVALDPVTCCYRRLWTLLADHTAFAALVPVGNRIRYDNDEPVPMRGREGVAEGDRPYVECPLGGGGYDESWSSDHTQQERGFDFLVAGETQQAHRQSWPVAWEMRKALRSVGGSTGTLGVPFLWDLRVTSLEGEERDVLGGRLTATETVRVLVTIQHATTDYAVVGVY